MTTAAPFQTVGDIARRKGVSEGRVKHAIRVARITEVQRAGVIRLFNFDQVQLIESTIERIALNPTPTKEPMIESRTGDVAERLGIVTKIVGQDASQRAKLQAQAAKHKLARGTKRVTVELSGDTADVDALTNAMTAAGLRVRQDDGVLIITK